jgi:nucleoside-diphosphate-sugar epimerase
LYLSSLDVYNFQNVVDEKTSPDPQTLYGHSKLFSEKILGAYSNTFGHALTVLRLGTLFGPGEREYEKVIPSMLKEAKAGLDLHLAGAGSERRSFLFVRDAASVIHEALITPEFPPLVNLVGQEEISILGLAEKISRIPATRVAVVNGPDSYLTVDHQFKKTLMNTISPRRQTPLDEALRIEFESIL